MVAVVTQFLVEIVIIYLNSVSGLVEVALVYRLLQVMNLMRTQLHSHHPSSINLDSTILYCSLTFQPRYVTTSNIYYVLHSECTNILYRKDYTVKGVTIIMVLMYYCIILGHALHPSCAQHTHKQQWVLSNNRKLM